MMGGPIQDGPILIRIIRTIIQTFLLRRIANRNSSSPTIGTIARTHRVIIPMSKIVRVVG